MPDDPDPVESAARRGAAQAYKWKSTAAYVDDVLGNHCLSWTTTLRRLPTLTVTKIVIASIDQLKSYDTFHMCHGTLRQLPIYGFATHCNTRTRTELDRRSFPVAAPTVWNSLPACLRSTLIGRRQFRDGLKSHLFADAYFCSSENIRYKSVMYLLTYLLTYLHCVRWSYFSVCWFRGF